MSLPFSMSSRKRFKPCGFLLLASILSALCTLVRAQPVVTISTPSNGAVAGSPGSFILTANATDTGATITEVDYFSGSTQIGLSSTSPYQVTWSGVSQGNYSLTAVAKDSLGASTTSAAVAVTVEQGPSIAPNSGNSSSFSTSSYVTLNYTATASSGSVVSVAVYRNGSLISTLSSASSGTTWTFIERALLPAGSYTYCAVATDSAGISTTSPNSVVSVQPNLPYLSDFEVAGGYAVGSLQGQLGWSVSQGTAAITASYAYSGSQSVDLTPSTPPAAIVQTFSPSTGTTLEFADFYAKPVAEVTVGSGTVFVVGGARFTFLFSGTQGVLEVFNGNGNGGGAWNATSCSVPLASNHQTQNWIRLTARLDYTAKTFDLYANGTMVAANAGFTDSTSTALTNFSITGDATSDTLFDGLLVTAQNPLFADVNNDGIDDAWESLYGLSLSVNDRTIVPNANGLTVLQDYLTGASPNDYYSGVLPVITSLVVGNQAGSQGLVSVKVTRASDGSVLANAPIAFSVTTGASQISATAGGALGTQVSVTTNASGIAQAYVTFGSFASESLLAKAQSGSNTQTLSIPLYPALTSLSGLRLWLDAGAGVTSSGGVVSQWNDQSGAGFNASQGTSSARPSLVSSVINSRPVVHFNGTSNFLTLGNFMSGASAGDMYLVLRASTTRPTQHAAPWDFSVSYGSQYPSANNHIYDGFGSTTQQDVGIPSQTITNFHVYNARSAASLWKASMDGSQLVSKTTNTVSFRSNPYMGAIASYPTYFFAGDLAEMIVFDHLLTDPQRATIGQYLNQKYALVLAAPSIPSSVAATAATSASVTVSWSADPNISQGVTYSILRSTGGGPYAVVGTKTDATSFTDTSVISSTSYSYEILASTFGGTSLASSSVSVTTPVGPNFSGLTLWVSAGTGVTLDANGGVSTWQDQSPNQYVVSQSNAGNRPTVVANSLNSLPVVHFSGNNQVLTVPNIMTGATAAEVFIVNRAAASSYQCLYRLGNGGGTNYPSSDGTIRDDFGLASQLNVGGASVLLTNYHLYNASAQANGSWVDRLNGDIQHTGSMGTASFSTAPLLGGGTGSSFAGDIAEVIVYSRVLTSSERAAIGQYLTQKYALAIGTPAVPANLSAFSISSSQVGVTWSPDPTIKRGVTYTVLRSVAGGSYSPVAMIVDGSSFIDTTVAAGVTYSYEVTAASYAASSGASSAQAVTPPASSPALPTSGMAIWLSADSGTEYSATGVASGWRDLSSNAYFASQSKTANQPTFSTGVVNGRPTIHFSSPANQYFTLPSIMSGATAGEVFIVNRVATGSYQAMYDFGTGGGTVYPSSDGTIRDDFGISSQVNAGPASVSLTSFHLYNASAQTGGSWTLRLNGDIQAVVPMNNTGFTTAPTLGSSPGNFFSGDIAEVIVYTRTLTVAERTAVAQYLTQKYALPIGTPATPGNLSAIPVSSSQVSLNWASDPTITHGVTYTVYRSSAGGGYVAIGSVIDGSSFLDSSATAATSYSYEVVASTYAGTSTASAPLSLTTPVSAPSLPTSGMAIWLSADNGVEWSTAGSVSGWRDMSGNGYLAAQSKTSNQPTYSANVVNGRPTIHFSSAGNQVLTLPNFMSGATAGELFIVNRVAASSYQAMYDFGAGGGGSYPASDGTVRDDFGLSSQVNAGPASISMTSFNLYNVSAQASGAWTLRLNGDIQYSAAIGTTTFTTGPLLGQGGSSFFSGDIAEVIAYTRVLTAAERLAVGQYLTHKYSLSVGTPSTPSGLMGNSISSTQISLTWSPDPVIGHGVTYTVLRSVSGGSFSAVATLVDSTSFVDSSLTPGTTYTYEIVANTLAGTSSISAPISATTSVSSASMPTSGMVLWLAGDNGVRTAANGNVLQWQDLSPNRSLVTNFTPANEPGLVSGAANGRSVVRLANANQSLSLPNLYNGASAGEIFYILRAGTATPSGNMTVSTLGSSVTTYGNTGGVVSDGFGSTSNYAVGVAPVTVTNFNLYNTSSQSGSWIARFNGVEGYLSTSNSVQFTSSPSLGKGFVGDIAEVIAYNRVLSAVERVSVETYLNAKYGILGNVSIPKAPLGVVIISASTSQVSLAWTRVAGANAYTLLRSTGGGSFTPIATIEDPNNTYTDSSPPSGQGSVQYEVLALNTAGSSGGSPAVTALLNPSAVDATDGLTYQQDVAIGLNPAADNSSAFPSAPSGVMPPPGPSEDPSVDTPPTLQLLTPSGGTLN